MQHETTLSYPKQHWFSSDGKTPESQITFVTVSVLRWSSLKQILSGAQCVCCWPVLQDASCQPPTDAYASLLKKVIIKHFVAWSHTILLSASNLETYSASNHLYLSCYTYTLKTAKQSADGFCTATTLALFSIKHKELVKRKQCCHIWSKLSFQVYQMEL